jgi:hypothetical protein
MNRIVFISRDQARRWIPVPNSVLISVYDAVDGPLLPRPGWEAVLPLCFDDADVEAPNVTLFDVAYAQK